jgi:hypothetical protein
VGSVTPYPPLDSWLLLFDGVYLNLGNPLTEPCLTQGPYSKPIQITSVVDTHHLDAESDADPDSSYHSNADQDPTFHSDANPDPDPDPIFQIKAQILKKCSNRLIFHTFWLFICKLMRIRFRIQLFTVMRIRIRMQIQVTKIMRIHNTASIMLGPKLVDLGTPLCRRVRRC